MLHYTKNHANCTWTWVQKSTFPLIKNSFLIACCKYTTFLRFICRSVVPIYQISGSNFRSTYQRDNRLIDNANSYQFFIVRTISLKKTSNRLLFLSVRLFTLHPRTVKRNPRKVLQFLLLFITVVPRPTVDVVCGASWSKSPSTPPKDSSIQWPLFTRRVSATMPHCWCFKKAHLRSMDN